MLYNLLCTPSNSDFVDRRKRRLQRRMREEELRLTRGGGSSEGGADSASSGSSDAHAAAAAADVNGWADAGDGWMSSRPGAASLQSSIQASFS